MIPSDPSASPAPNGATRPPAVRRFLGCLLPILVLCAGAAVLAVLVRTRPSPAKAPTAELAVPVEVVPLAGGPERVRVRAQGTVLSAQSVVVQPEVSGRIVWQHSELVPGGRVSKGEPLFRVDPRDYQAALEQQKAQLASSQMLLEQEQGRRVVAEREWGLLGGEQRTETHPGRALALREPQLDTAKASLEAARSALAQAKLNVTRTTLTAPFNAVVQAENVDVGQLVTQQFQAATLVGTDAFWVQVSIPLEDLAFIDVPKTKDQRGSPARIWQQIGSQRVERQGRVLRLLGDLDPVGRMARVLVEVQDPLGLKTPNPKTPAEPASEHEAPKLPLLLGAFVNIEIEGAPLPAVLEVPRRALREGDRVFVVRDGTLAIVPVRILWRTEQAVFVQGPLAQAEQVVVSPMRTAVAGMPLRVMDTKVTPSGATPPEPASATPKGAAP